MAAYPLTPAMPGLKRRTEEPETALQRRVAARLPLGALLALPVEILEIILWHCGHGTSSSLASACHATRAHIRRSCWESDAWLVARAPLSLLLPLGHASDGVCQRRLGAHPEDAKATVDPSAYGGEGRCLPLHLALAERPAAVDLQLALLRAHPAAIGELCNEWDMSPLEYAAERGAAAEVVFALLEAHEASNTAIACPPYQRPLTALHLAIINGASDRIVRALLRAGPEAAELWGCENGFDDEFTDLLPLHLAAVYGPRRGHRAARVVELLCAASPRAAATREGRHGMTALHLAALSAASVEALEAIAWRFPAALHLTDDYGRTPLDCARASAEAVASARLGRTPPLPAGYTYREYAGLNPRTLRALQYREGDEHLTMLVSCLEALTLAQPKPTEDAEPPRTWRYSYVEGSYGTALQEQPGAASPPACDSPMQ